jgi:hypothetical protein
MRLVRELVTKSLRQVAGVLVVIALAAILRGDLSKDTLEGNAALLSPLIWCAAIWLGVALWDREHTGKTWGFHLTKPLARELLVALTFGIGLVFAAVALWVGMQVLPFVLTLIPWPASWEPVITRFLGPAPVLAYLTEAAWIVPPYVVGFTTALWAPVPRSFFRTVPAIALLIAYYGAFENLFESWQLVWAAPFVFAVLALGACFGLIKELQPSP